MRRLISAAALVLTFATANAQGFSVAPYGPSCGPVASGAVTPVGSNWRFAFTVSEAAPHVSVMNILGVSEQSTPINFGASCYLLTDIAFAQIHRTDAAGTFTWSHALPGGFSGEAFIQFAELRFDEYGELIVRTSNGLHMVPN